MSLGAGLAALALLGPKRNRSASPAFTTPGSAPSPLPNR
ncbi:MAG: hypothetical protein JST93_05315 [Acidobacteria bacterium]|nr:hypothetical protein [Acidobacteriota bacterium]